MLVFTSVVEFHLLWKSFVLELWWEVSLPMGRQVELDGL